MKFFVDRDLGAKLGNALRAIGIPTTNHRHRYPHSDAESVPDSQWITDATALDEVVITRDGGVHRRRSAELAAIVNAGARGFVLETGNATPLDNLRAMMLAWPRIIEIVDKDSPPFLYGIDRRGRVKRRYP